ncbi:MAG: serine/threonine protein kinase, partial [Conexivisphaera sp.]
MSTDVIHVNEIIDNRFQVLKELARGGMGVVYKGYDQRDDRYVVIKVPNYGVQADAVLLQEKLKSEADVLSRLSHKNIVKFVKSGNIGAHPYLVVEFVEGTRLDEYVKRRGGLDPEEAYRISLKLLKVLEYIHGQNLLHRDFTPDNVMIREKDKEPIVIDFGTAREISGVVRVTRIEKGYYTPPEMLLSTTYTQSSDIYMWGATLASMLRCRSNGNPCIDEIDRGSFNATSRHGPYLSFGKKPCDVLECGGYEAIFNTVLLKSLNPDPAERYSSVRDIIDYLSNVVVNAPAQADCYIQVMGGRKVNLDYSKVYVLGTEGDVKLDSSFV